MKGLQSYEATGEYKGKTR